MLVMVSTTARITTRDLLAFPTFTLHRNNVKPRPSFQSVSWPAAFDTSRSVSRQLDRARLRARGGSQTNQAGQ